MLTDPSAPLQDGQVSTHGPVIGYVRSLGIAGKSAKVDAIASFACASGSATFRGERGTRDVCGFADPRIRLSVNLLGAPALSLAEYASYRQRTILGSSLQVALPLGGYDPDTLLNLGTNRLSIKPGLGISRAVGRFTLEASASATFDTRNDDYFGDQVKEQAPLYAAQGHVVYGFRSGIWFALDATFYGGGEGTLNGVAAGDRRHSLKLHASSGAYARTGSDFDLFAVSWQYRWGGGLR